MKIVRLSALLTVFVQLVACGEGPAPAPPVAPQVATAKSGELAVLIQPAQPVAGDCLRVQLKGQAGRAAYQWAVNGQRVAADRPGELCGNVFRRGDAVTVQVEREGARGTASVTIGNRPPRVTGISATPKDLHAGLAIEVFPVAEDGDDDPVEFRYQWLINDEPDPFLTEAKLPGDRVVRGERIQVLITPFDGTDEGTVYRSYVMTVPGAPPKILSQPPQAFEGHEYRYQFVARDPDGDKLAYALEKAPAGMTIDRAGLVVWPLAGVKAGQYTVKIVATDPDGAAAAQEYNLTLGTASPAATRQP